MLIRDVMTSNVITVASSTPLAEIRRLMETHRIRRVPVVDNEKLLGIVTRNALEREVSSLLSTLTASDMMVSHLVTVSPEDTVEEVVALAQAKRVGALLVLKQDRLVGIATTNDFFYKILNPLLGIELPGTRISIQDCARSQDVEKILHIINELNIGVLSMFTMRRQHSPNLLFTVHLDTEDARPVMDAIRKQGYRVETRRR